MLDLFSQTDMYALQSGFEPDDIWFNNLEQELEQEEDIEGYVPN